MQNEKLDINVLATLLGYEEWELKMLRRHLRRAGVEKPAGQWVWPNRKSFLKAAKQMDNWSASIDPEYTTSTVAEFRNDIDWALDIVEYQRQAA